MPWTIWWNTQVGATEWNTAIASTEAGALDMAQHFLKLKFAVFAIRHPDGTIYMDEEQIAARFSSSVHGD
jgi:hypothetical protein